jgi:hypothetical protein
MSANEYQPDPSGNGGSDAVKRELCFYSDPADGSQPLYISDDPNLKGTRNYNHSYNMVNIQDARGFEDTFALSTHGFSLLQDLPVPSVTFDVVSEVNEIYIPFVLKTLSSLFGNARTVVPFTSTIRRASATGRQERPIRKVHIDQSEAGAYLRARHELASDPGLLQEILMNRVRYRIINMWKPINHPVRDRPLVFADSRTVADSDLIPVKQVYPHYTGETYAVRHSPAHKFWFWSDMQTNEAILLQCYDNAGKVEGSGSGFGARVAHVSFSLTVDESESSERESIEVRCIVITSL